MKNRFIYLFLSLLLAAQVSYFPVFAADIEYNPQYTSVDEPEDPIISSTYLINNKAIYVSISNGRLYVHGTTDGVTTMDTIGIKDIVVERSNNGTTGWTPVAYPSAYYEYNTTSCEMKKWITVSHGYYYRITCNHYAYKSGWSPNSQTEPNTSNSVYIS